MSRRVVQTSERSYLFSPDDPVAPGGRLWAIVQVSVRDEMTGAPPAGPITAHVKEPGLRARVAGDGMVVVTGVPLRAFSMLNVPPNDYHVNLTVAAEGYVTREVEVLIANDPSFPANFTPPPLINLLLHREPVVIGGRVVRANGGSTVPLAGAAITFTGIWRTPPPANIVVAADPPDLVSLSPPLYAERSAVPGPAAGHLRQRDLPTVLGDDKALMEDVLAGALEVRLTNRLNLNVGDIVMVDADRPEVAEFIAIGAINGASTPDQPARLTLAYSLAGTHPRGAVVRAVNPQPVGGTKNFSVDALAGDTCVFLNNLGGLAPANQVEVFGGSPDEYHGLKLFSVQSDSEGYYRLPPLSRVAQLEIHAEKVVGPQLFQTTTTFRPNYQQRENRLDLVLAV